MTTPDPSYKSKRYRDNLRLEVRELELTLPLEKCTLHRKLDSQTVFRTAIALFRTKLVFQDILGQRVNEPDLHTTDRTQTPVMTQVEMEDLLECLDGFLMMLTTDGVMIYLSNTVTQMIGFSQIDLLMRSIYGITHPDDHYEVKSILEDTEPGEIFLPHLKSTCCLFGREHQSCQYVSFLCRMKCFNGTNTGYMKMHCVGHKYRFGDNDKSPTTHSDVFLTYCRPFLSVTNSREPDSVGFWTKHGLDLTITCMDKCITEVLGHEMEQLQGVSLYKLIHPEDLYVMKCFHTTLLSTDEIHTVYIRIQTKEYKWCWLHTKGKVAFKSSKRYSIVFTHCPVREEDSSYIQQEKAFRHQNAIRDLMSKNNIDTLSPIPVLCSRQWEGGCHTRNLAQHRLYSDQRPLRVKQAQPNHHSVVSIEGKDGFPKFRKHLVATRISTNCQAQRVPHRPSKQKSRSSCLYPQLLPAKYMDEC